MFSLCWLCSLMHRIFNVGEIQLTIFFFVTCAFDVITKKSLQNPVSWSFPLFSSNSFIFLALIFSPFWVDFYIWFKIRVQLIFYVFSIAIVKKTVLSPLNGLSTVVKKHLTIYVRVYCWALYSISLVNMSGLMSE